MGWWHSHNMESHKSHVPNHQPDDIFMISHYFHLFSPPYSHWNPQFLGWLSQPAMLLVLTILKNMKVNGKDDNPYMENKSHVFKPPTSNVIYIYIYYHHYIPIEIPNLLDGYPIQQCYMWLITLINHNYLGPAGSQQIHGDTQRRSSCLERIHGVGGQPWARRPGTIAMGQAVKDLMYIYIYTYSVYIYIHIVCIYI